MSESPIALLACPDDPDHPELSMNWFPSSLDASFQCFLAVTTKTSTPKGIQVLNLSANYPAPLARIESIAAVTGARQLGLPHLAASLLLLSLEKLMVTYPDVSRVVLLRGALAVDPVSLPAAFAEMSGSFTMLADNPANIMYDRHGLGAALAMALAMDTVMSGALYGLPTDELPDFLTQVGGAFRSSAMSGLTTSVAAQAAQSQSAARPLTHELSL